MKNVQDKIDAGKLGVIFEPFTDIPLNTTDEYFFFDAIINEINFLSGQQLPLSKNPNQTR